MPEFKDRFEYEAKIATGVSDVFAELRAAYDRGEPVPWDRLKTVTQETLEDELTAVYLLVFLIMADDGLQNVTALAQSQGRAWVSTHAKGLATALVGNARRELASGTPADRVFGGQRAAVLAATEVTRAISQAEIDARRANAAAGKPRPEAPRPSPEERPGEPAPPGPGISGSLLDVGDGLTAIWITERDDRVCPICRPLHRRPARDWDTLFPQGPPAHPNCRCSLEYVPAEPVATAR